MKEFEQIQEKFNSEAEKRNHEFLDFVAHYDHYDYETLVEIRTRAIERDHHYSNINNNNNNDNNNTGHIFEETDNIYIPESESENENENDITFFEQYEQEIYPEGSNALEKEISELYDKYNKIQA